MKFQSKVLLGALATVALVACSGEGDPNTNENRNSQEDHDHLAQPQGRLLVADGAEGKVIVVDLELGEAIATLSLQGPARLSASSDGARGFAVETSSDSVEAIDPGLAFVEHGDHFDAVEEDPEVLSEVVVSCSRPVHFVPHSGHSAAFCDGDGLLHVFDDTKASDYTIDTFDSGRPHHGVGLVVNDQVLLSLPNLEDEADALPLGVQVLDFSGQSVAHFETCPALHGEAATESHACFGCGDGVLCLSSDASGSWSELKITNPASAEEGRRVGTLSASAHTLVGNWGEDLILVDLEAEELKPISVGETYLQFRLEDDEHVLVLTAAGDLIRFDVATGAEVARAAVIPNFTVEPGHGQLRPSFVFGQDHIYIVDPRHSEVYELEQETLELSERTLELGAGEFHSLALVASPPSEAHH